MIRRVRPRGDTMPAPPAEEILSAHHVLAYDYRRSVGPVLGRFFTALRDRSLIGSVTPDGRVLVPPMEYDPETGEALDQFTDVGPGGVVTTWAWVNEPMRNHRLRRPFAFALIQLDGASSGLLHIVDTGDEARMRTGMRVTPRWAAETVGSILDIECFVPEDAG
jgi:uncharacterized OB-fold protein